MKAFVVDLDSRENQSILKSSTRCSNNQAHQVNEAVKKIDKLIKNAPYSNDDIILNHNKIKEAFFSPFKPQLKSAQVFLSHSHADKNKALEVKNYLESETNHKVFVDSLFWDYKDDVLSKKNKALEVKNYLESETNHKVFVDSLFWDYKDDVLSKKIRL